MYNNNIYFFHFDESLTFCWQRFDLVCIKGCEIKAGSISSAEAIIATRFWLASSRFTMVLSIVQWNWRERGYSVGNKKSFTLFN